MVVATLLAHTGYDTTSYFILDTVTDVVEEYINKIVHLLRITVDKEVMSESSTFPDANTLYVLNTMKIVPNTTISTLINLRLILYPSRNLGSRESMKAILWIN